MTDWLILAVLLALGLLGYRLMGQLDRFLDRNLDGGAAKKSDRMPFTLAPRCFIMEENDTEGGAVDGIGPAIRSVDPGQAS